MDHLLGPQASSPADRYPKSPRDIIRVMAGEDACGPAEGATFSVPVPADLAFREFIEWKIRRILEDEDWFNCLWATGCDFAESNAGRAR